MKKRVKFSRLHLISFAVAAGLTFLTAVTGGAAEQATAGGANSSANIATPPSRIAVVEVAKQATEAANLIRTFNAKLAAGAQIEAVSASLPNAAKLIDMEASTTTQMLQGRPSLDAVERQQLLWRQRQIVVTSWLNLLTERAAMLQDLLNRLAELDKSWAATREAAQAENVPETILRQIDDTLAAIAGEEAPIQTQRTALLDLQARVAKEVASCENVLAEIDRFEQQAVTGILSEGKPIWSVELWADIRTTLIERIGKVSTAFRADIVEYVRDSSAGMPLHLGLFLVLALVFWAVHQKAAQWVVTGESASSAVQVFDSPFAAALVVTLTLLTGVLSQIPIAVRELFRILACVPMIILMRPVAKASVMRAVYSLSFLFAIDTVRSAFAGAAAIDQVILVLETLGGVFVTAWLLASISRSRGEQLGQAAVAILRPGASLLLVAFAAGLVGASIGYLRLASLAISGILAAGITALLLYTFVRVANGLIAFALHVWPLRALRMVQNHRDLLEKRTYYFLLIVAVFALVFRYLDAIALLQPALSFGQTMLATKLERGSISISVGDVAAFFLTVWTAYLLSGFIRFVLEEDVYPRTRITPGMSYATSSLLHYLILAVGFVAAIGVLGVDLGKVTVLAGAFSVGIGFGLQSVVNNFVSGLILLFERPIDKGDSVEIGNLRGTVRHIGIRASVVRTSQGADIIVPNAQFITEKVTNWTHGDRSMRIDLPIGVNYETSPKTVIDLLEAVARAYPEVLQDPPPKAVFIGFGDSSINFELRVWTDDLTHATQIRTDLALAVYDAVNAAGMSFPFPQREVRLLSDSQSDPSMAFTNAADAENRADASAQRTYQLPQKEPERGSSDAH